jgi:hypothetical protein
MQIAPRNMFDIMGLMQPDAAERLTVELARRAGGDKATPGADLPKIEGKIMSQKGMRARGLYGALECFSPSLSNPV